MAIQQDDLPKEILKKSLAKKIDGFLKTLKKMLKKKKLLFNAFKQKLSMDKLKSRTIVISILNLFEKEKLIIFIPKRKTSTFAIKKVNVSIIDAYFYCTVCKPKVV